MDYQAWCEEGDRQMEEEKLRYRQIREENVQKQIKEIEEYRKKHGDYWKYSDVYIPIEIRSVPAYDKVNSVSIVIAKGDHFIFTTQVATTLQGYTPNEYHEKFCEYDKENDRWVYVGRK
jgi:hypothetical protein